MVADTPLAILRAKNSKLSGPDAERIRQLAIRLADDARMEKVWKQIFQRLNRLKMPRSELTALWIEIHSAHRAAKAEAIKPSPSRTAYKQKYKSIAAKAKKLGKELRGMGLDVAVYQFLSKSEAKAIHQSSTGSAKSGSQDIQAQWLAKEAGIPIEAALIEIATGRQPSLSMLLERVSSKAAEASQRAMTMQRMVDRPKKLLRPDVTYFIRRLSAYMTAKFGGAMDGTVATLTSVVLEAEVGSEDVDNALKPVKREMKRGGTKATKK